MTGRQLIHQPVCELLRLGVVSFGRGFLDVLERMGAKSAANLIEAIERGNVAQLRSGIPGG